MSKLYEIVLKLKENMYSSQNSISEGERQKLYNDYLCALRKAAYAGNPDAQYELGLQYEDINYVSLNNPRHNSFKSLYWYEKACKQNHAEACLSLASYYSEGKAVKKDEAKEINLLLKSFQLGNKLAAESIAMFYKEKKEYNKSIVWLNKSIEISPKNGEAKFELAKFFYEGIGARKSFKKAYSLFLKALATDYITEYTREEIYFYIGKMYFYGQFLEKNLSKAKYLIKKANMDKDHDEIEIFYNNHIEVFEYIKTEKVLL